MNLSDYLHYNASENYYHIDVVCRLLLVLYLRLLWYCVLNPTIGVC
ncbi:hypothetical protein THOB06_50141 [Vibrio rotiferianus]|nr:hypothetical protein THOE12_10332 [Vibrio rotiferianus]CAH1590141.1 hypothetical protein THOG10_50141 [Vibrio rotiferianus]CAH1591517.1 hypothetical protein THOB06_50141 [Vibrio rotiferianus]